MRAIVALLVLSFFLAACAGREPEATLMPEPTTPASPSAASETPPPDIPPAPESSPQAESLNRRVPDATPFLVAQLLPLDGIAPIYEPRFVAAAEAPLLDDELIIGVEMEGAAKAYPITVLRFREMVNDELDGIPILVTW